MEPWVNTYIIFSVYYFESVVAANTLNKIGPLFIGMVKTTIKRFPMKYFSDIYIVDKVDRSVDFTNGANWIPILLYFLLMSFEHWCFIAY